MTDLEMRKFMESMDSTEKQPVDEAGGIIDKGLAALGSEKAAGKVTREKERKNIASGWKTYQGEQDVRANDPEAFKEFLAYWNFDGEEIDQIMTDPFKLKASLAIASKIQTKSRKGVTGAERGGPIEKKTPKDDVASIITFFQKSLGGNPAQLQMELAAIKKPEQLGNDPLAMLGYAFMKASGKGKK